MILVGVGGFFFVLGTLIFIIDAFRVHWGWGLGVLFVPLANLVFVFKHWEEAKRGFILSLLAVPLLGTAFALQPKPVEGAAKDKFAVHDPFAAAMTRAREAVAKVEETRREGPPPATSPTDPTTVQAAPAPAALPASTPAPTVKQRLAANRQAFKQLAEDFQQLNDQRKTLPKNDLAAIRAFNEQAAAYTAKLAAARAEQEDLLGLQKTK